MGFAVGQIQKTLFVNVTDITQGCPAAGIARLCGFLRVVVVFEGFAIGKMDRARGAGGHFKAVFVTNFQLAHHRFADRAFVAEPVGRAHQGHAIALGACVIFPDHRAPPVNHLLLDRDRAGRGGVDGKLKAGHVMRRALFRGQFQHANKHGGHGLGMGDFVFLNQAQKLLRVEMVHDHAGRTQTHADHVETQGRCVVQRRGRQINAAAIDAVDVAANVNQGGGRVDLRKFRRHENTFGAARGAR